MTCSSTQWYAFGPFPHSFHQKHSKDSQLLHILNTTLFFANQNTMRCFQVLESMCPCRGICYNPTYVWKNSKTRIDHIFADKIEGFHDIHIKDLDIPPTDHVPYGFRYQLKSPIAVIDHVDVKTPQGLYIPITKLL